VTFSAHDQADGKQKFLVYGITESQPQGAFTLYGNRILRRAFHFSEMRMPLYYTGGGARGNEKVSPPTSSFRFALKNGKKAKHLGVRSVYSSGKPIHALSLISYDEPPTRLLTTILRAARRRTLNRR